MSVNFLIPGRGRGAFDPCLGIGVPLRGKRALKYLPCKTTPSILGPCLG